MGAHKDAIKNLYLGILNNYSDFSEEANACLSYDFDAVEFAELRSRYKLENIAKSGTSFEKARRLLHYLAPRLAHLSFYDNHVECNALKLLEYSFENSEHGINCLNKSKILAECCLALGIFARRVFIRPFSPFDFDSHVVCEIFDEKLNKWIMLDPTTDGYFVDEKGTPLSMTEIRTGFVLSKFQTFVFSNGRNKDLAKAKQRNEDINVYIMKNCFRMTFEQYNGFGKKNGIIDLIPKNYDICKNEELNRKFRIENLPKEYAYFADAQKKYCKESFHIQKPIGYSVASVYAKPTANK